jgi:hypothetical protein
VSARRGFFAPQEALAAETLHCGRGLLTYAHAMVLEAADFQALTDSALQLFDERIAAADSEFEIEVARLESQVVQLYGIAALLARREMDLEKIGNTWAAMISVCDTVAQRIQALCAGHPFCVASHDKILDIRNKAARLRDLHLE